MFTLPVVYAVAVAITIIILNVVIMADFALKFNDDDGGGGGEDYNDDDDDDDDDNDDDKDTKNYIIC